MQAMMIDARCKSCCLLQGARWLRVCGFVHLRPGGLAVLGNGAFHEQCVNGQELWRCAQGWQGPPTAIAVSVTPGGPPPRGPRIRHQGAGPLQGPACTATANRPSAARQEHSIMRDRSEERR